MKITWFEKEDLMDAAVRAMRSVEIVLDIGCGIMPQNYIKPQVHICCEPYQEYVDHLQQKIAALDARERSYIVLNMGWQDTVRYFPPKSVDTVFLVDVIEHLEKVEGQRLLAETEKIARNQVVVFTPLGFMPQHHGDGKDAWGLSGADWQEHKSGWFPEDFSGEFWQVLGAKEFHLFDSSSKPLEQPFGAFWAIKTYPDSMTRPFEIDQQLRDALKEIELNLRQRQDELEKKHAEINSLLLAKIERKIRQMLSKNKL